MEIDKKDIENAVKGVIEGKTGIVIDGKVTLSDVTSLLKFAREVVDQVYPDRKERLDHWLDAIEEDAQDEKRVKKVAMLTFTKGLRIVGQCPDDDGIH